MLNMCGLNPKVELDLFLRIVLRCLWPWIVKLENLTLSLSGPVLQFASHFPVQS
jgi:hypothetical protein